MATSTPSIRWNVGTSTAVTRAWGAAINAALSGLGLVQTADTGQINWATMTDPIAANSQFGYEIWRLNDALQSTHPVFFKLEFGSANMAGYPVIVISGGIGSNGAGTLTDPGNRLYIQTAGGLASAQTCHLSGDTDRFIFQIAHTSAAYDVVLFLERFKYADGSNSGNGFAYGGISSSSTAPTWGTNTPLIPGVQTYEFGIQPIAYYPFSISPVAGPAVGTTTAILSTNAPMFPVLPIGSCVFGPLSQLWAYYNADIASGTVFNASVYGTTRSFKAMGNIGLKPPTIAAHTGNVARIAIANW